MGNLANSISNIPHLKAFDDVFKSRFDNFDFTAILMYMIDTAPSSALIHLAEQFDVLGFKGWIMAVTDHDKRSLIKRAISLHKKAGTPFAIRQAVEAVGFEDVQVVEHVGITFDGEYDWDGAVFFSGGGWATFRVKVTLPDDREMLAADLFNLQQLIGVWKNARSHLIDITFKLKFAENLNPSEFLDMGEGSEDFIMAGAYFDGGSNFDGAVNFNKGVDSLNLTITNVLNNTVINEQI